MPIYEYRCDACGHQQECIQKVGAEPLIECPLCAESALKKLVSAAAFRLKGTGWYETDFKNGGKKKPESKEGAKQSPENSSDSKGSKDASGGSEKAGKVSDGSSSADSKRSASKGVTAP